MLVCSEPGRPHKPWPPRSKASAAFLLFPSTLQQRRYDVKRTHDPTKQNTWAVVRYQNGDRSRAVVKGWYSDRKEAQQVFEEWGLQYPQWTIELVNIEYKVITQMGVTQKMSAAWTLDYQQKKWPDAGGGSRRVKEGANKGDA
jgi:hypothetical protein